MIDTLSRLFPSLSERFTKIERDVKAMADELAHLRTAVAHNIDATARLYTYLQALKTQLDGVSAQLAALQAQEVINPADVQAAADQVDALAADVGAHIPAEPAPAVDPVADPAAPAA